MIPKINAWDLKTERTYSKKLYQSSKVTINKLQLWKACNINNGHIAKLAITNISTVKLNEQQSNINLL